jgi:hypothetical protein
MENERKNISFHEIHPKEAFLSFGKDAHSKILCGEFTHNYVGGGGVVVLQCTEPVAHCRGDREQLGHNV